MLLNHTPTMAIIAPIRKTRNHNVIYDLYNHAIEKPFKNKNNHKTFSVE